MSNLLHNKLREYLEAEENQKCVQEELNMNKEARSYSQVITNLLDNMLREDLERLKKMKNVSVTAPSEKEK